MDDQLPLPEELIDLLPQKKPFLFVDQITDVNTDGIIGKYKFKNDEYFYEGHFPGFPTTPGVILLECMCQIGVVAHGIYLFAKDHLSVGWKNEFQNWITLFSEAEQSEFYRPILPNTEIIIQSEKIFWKRKKLKSKITMTLTDGTIVARTIAAGIGVRK